MDMNKLREMQQQQKLVQAMNFMESQGQSDVAAALGMGSGAVCGGYGSGFNGSYSGHGGGYGYGKGSNVLRTLGGALVLVGYDEIKAMLAA